MMLRSEAPLRAAYVASPLRRLCALNRDGSSPADSQGTLYDQRHQLRSNRAGRKCGRSEWLVSAFAGPGDGGITSMMSRGQRRFPRANLNVA